MVILFVLLVICTIVSFYLTIHLIRQNDKRDGYAFGLTILFAACAVILPTGSAEPQEAIASEDTAHNWLIVDNTGGKVQRHWILEDNIITERADGAGWIFSDQAGNTYIMGNQTFAVKIAEPLEDFLKHYKDTVSIPTHQKPMR